MSSGWNTIVSEPGVFTKLVSNLGVKNIQIDELFSIDSYSLRELAPVHAVIFLFKYSSIDREYAQRNLPLDGIYDKEYRQKGVFFAQQTIQNACATLAVLNALFNCSADIDVGEELQNMRLFISEFDPEMCGETLSNSEVIRTVHNSFSAPPFIDTSEIETPPRNDNDDGLFHFVAYVNIHNTIYELDGLKQYPIKHDLLANEDEFYDKLPEVLQRRISKYAGEIRYSLLAITSDKLKHYELMGDTVGVSRESYKRQQWDYEINLRKHQYSRLTAELIKNISVNTSDQEWAKIILDAKRANMNRLMKEASLFAGSKSKGSSI